MKNTLFPKLLVVLTISFITGFFSNLFAQPQFITSVTPLSLTDKQNEMKERVIKNSFYKKMEFVQLGNLPALQIAGILKFSIPGRIGDIEATATKIKSYSSENYEWYGKIDGGLGTMIILNKNGKISGSIYLPDETYEIISTDNDNHILLTYDKIKAEPINKCGTDEKPILKTNKKKTSATSFREAPCIDYAKVLVLFTPSAQATVADINQTIDLCIAQFNSAVYNSAIPGGATIQLAGRQLYNFTETNFYDDDLNFLVNDINAQTARNNTNADYVILLTNGVNYYAYGSSATVEPDDAKSYALVQVTQATNERKTFAHEAGHLYGCRHDDQPHAYARGYIFRPGFLQPRCYTLMVTGDEITGDRSRLLNFSNPNVFISGEATGTNDRNNARRVTETYGTLRNFRNPPVPELAASIDGPLNGYECTQANWEAVVSCGTAPYTYYWEYSDDGFNYYYGGSGEFYSATLPCGNPAYAVYYVRVTVTSSNGQTATGFLSTNVIYSNGSIEKDLNNNPIIQDLALRKIKDNQVSAFPNPAQNTIQMKIELKETQPVKLEIINSLGQAVIVLFEGNLTEGVHSKHFDVGRLVKGMYSYKLTGKTFRISKKLIIQ